MPRGVGLSNVGAAPVSEPGFWHRARAFLLCLLEALRTVNFNALAAQVAYSLIFSMPSILLVVALIARAVDERTGFAISREIRDVIVTALPAGVQPVIHGLIDDAVSRAREGPSTLSAVIAVLVALGAAGNGLSELARAFARAAGIDDERPAWVKRFVFTGAAVLIATMLIAAFTLYVWGGGLVALVSARFGQEAILTSAWAALQGLVILLLVFVGTTLLYMTSGGRYSFREMAPGAAVATILWLIVGKGFQVYLQVANPGTAYGAASSVLVFLVFLYVSSMGLILGALVAAVMVRRSRQGRDDDPPAGVCPPVIADGSTHA
jgi:membrane protein